MMHKPLQHIGNEEHGIRGFIPAGRASLLMQPVAPVKHMQTGNDILIVDDEVAIAQLLADVFHEEGYGIRVAHDGASALLEIQQRRPGLVLLDVAMPVMLGSDLLVYLRRHGFSDLPIIIMTAGLSPLLHLAQGATEVLPKPFDVNMVVEKVAQYLPLERGRAAGDE
jgi:DNA-binding response OmpR family regulator